MSEEHAMPRTVHFKIGEQVRSVQVTREGDHFHVEVGERRYVVAAQQGALGRLDLCIDGRRRRAYAVQQGDRVYVWLDGETYTLVKTDLRRRSARPGDVRGSLEAAMPGKVLDVLVSEGDAVQRGQVLVLLEAMKMELRIQATQEGVVRSVWVRPGQVVERGQRLVEIT
jgi:biotin carboxyl carrier protein